MAKVAHLTALANGSLLRSATLNQRKYIVVPVISMIGDTVVWPVNAPYPEFIPSDVLRTATQSRNNRPVVMNHPQDASGEYISANDPATLEKVAFGFTFNSHFDETDKRIKSEMWLDPIRASEVGPDATRVIERLEAGEMVEVSEGNFIGIDSNIKGEANGQPYVGVWLWAVNDHLAALDEHSTGACSIEMGCGALRTATKKESNPPPSFPKPPAPTPPPAPGSGYVSIRVNDNFIPKIWEALSDSFDNFEFVLGVGGSEVVYGTTPDFLETGVVEHIYVVDYSVIGDTVVIGKAPREIDPKSPDYVTMRNRMRANRTKTSGGYAPLRVAALSQARTPKYTGTETVSWSAPSFSTYVKYLHPGAPGTGPRSVSQCSSDLKQLIAAHSLLGDPSASNLRDLAFFPCVNPATGKLNEKALRAIISGRGSSADIDSKALESAQDMARRLLNSEFGEKLMANKVNGFGMFNGKERKLRVASEGVSDEDVREWLRRALLAVESNASSLWVEAVFESSVVYTVYREGLISNLYERSYSLDAANAVTLGTDRTEVRRKKVEYEPITPPTLSIVTASKRFAGKLLDLVAGGFRSQVAEDSLGDNELWRNMWETLSENVPQFSKVFDIYQSESTVVYVTMNMSSYEEYWWQRSFTLDDAGKVTLSEEAQQIEPVTVFKPVETEETMSASTSAGEANPHKPCSCKGGAMAVSAASKEIINRLVANASSPFKAEDAKTLEAMSEDTLKSLDEKYKPETPATAPTVVAATTTTTTTTTPKTEEEFLREAPESIRSLVESHRRQEAETRTNLITALKSAQSVFTEDQLKAKPTDELRSLHKLVIKEEPPNPFVDYSTSRVVAASAQAPQEFDGWASARKPAN